MDVHGNDNMPEWGYCQVKGCHEAAIPCYDDGNAYPYDPDALLCQDHAAEHDYCWSCGRRGITFWETKPDEWLGACDSCCKQWADTAATERYHSWLWDSGR